MRATPLRKLEVIAYMTKEMVRCPYCVSGNEFHPMVSHVDGRFICNKCGHVSHPEDLDHRCNCPNCKKLSSHYNHRAAS